MAVVKKRKPSPSPGDEWDRVSAARPCPVCEGDGNCTVSKDARMAWCGRVESPKKNAGGQWLHTLTAEQRQAWLAHRGRKKPVPQKDWRAMAERFQAAEGDWLDGLAEEFGVETTILEALGVGWNGKAWTFPERDGAGNVVGINCRLPNGQKRQLAGGHRGLTYAADWAEYDGPVYVVEGGSDVAAGLSDGMCVVGRGSARAGAEQLAELLADAPAEWEIVVLGENDKKDDGRWPGRDGAIATAGRLAELLSRPVNWAMPPEGVKDLRAFFATGGKKEDIAEWPVEVVESTPLEMQLRTTRLSDVEPKEIDWLWEGRIALGKLTILTGDPGLGKSQLALDLASRVTTGKRFPFEDLRKQHKPGTAIILTAEDDLEDIVRPRLDRQKADSNRVIAVDGTRRSDGSDGPLFSLVCDIPKLDLLLRKNPDTSLVVIDPVSAYMSTVDSHNNSEVRSVLSPLAELASRHHVAVVAVTHLNKATGGKASYRSMGSIAFVAAARAAWLVTLDPDQPGHCLFVCVKNNLSSIKGGLTFHTDDNGFHWGKPVEITADTAMARELESAGKQSAIAEAEEWLRELLSKGPVLQKEIMNYARENGFSQRTLERVKSNLEITSKREGFGPDSKVYWEPPKT